MSNQIRTFTIMQYADDLSYWHDDDEYKVALTSADHTRAVGEVMVSKLSRNGYPIRSLYIICHDRSMKEGRLVRKHYHVLVRLARTRPTKDKIAESLNLDVDRIEGLRKGKYSYDDCLSYLIHMKYPERTIYDPREVVSFIDNNNLGKDEKEARDYINIYDERRISWESSREYLAKDKPIDPDEVSTPDEIVVVTDDVYTKDYTKYPLVKIIKLIYDGVLDEEAFRRNTSLAAIATVHEKDIAKAFRGIHNISFLYDERSAFVNLREKVFQSRKYPSVSMLVWGPSRTGKTRSLMKLADMVSDMSRELFGIKWREFVGCNTGDMTSQYGNEEIFRVNDFTDETLNLRQFLAMGEDVDTSNMTSRYDNNFLVSKLIQLSSNESPDKLFYRITSGTGSTDGGMFYERLGIVCQVDATAVTDLKSIRGSDLYSTEFVRLSTYVPELVTMIVDTTDLVSRTDFVTKRDSILDIVEYSCRKRFSFKQINDMISNLIRQYVMIPMLNDPDNRKYILDVRRELELERIRLSEGDTLRELPYR